MMHSRIGRVSAIFVSAVMLGFGIYAGKICFDRMQPAYGMAIIISFAVMFVCVLFLAVKGILDIEQMLYAQKGCERSRIACKCEYRDFESADGTLVFYEKGMVYEVDGNEPLGILPYDKFSYAIRDESTVMAFVASSIKARVLTLETASVLKAKAVLSQMRTGGIEIR